MLDRVLIRKMRMKAAEKGLAATPPEQFVALLRERLTSRADSAETRILQKVVGYGLSPHSSARTRSRTQEEPMSDTLDGLRRKIAGAGDLESVVRSMKALARRELGQYEKSVLALADYYRTVELGLAVCLSKRGSSSKRREARNEGRARDASLPISPLTHGPRPSIAIVFGSDQGLVGQFNDVLADFVARS